MTFLLPNCLEKMTKQVLTEIQFYKFSVCTWVRNAVGSLKKVVFESIAPIRSLSLLSQCESITASAFGFTLNNECS